MLRLLHEGTNKEGFAGGAGFFDVFNVNTMTGGVVALVSDILGACFLERIGVNLGLFGQRSL
ncbi:MAG: hypothetical protein ACKVGW_13155 [Verrucomicrobiia bacterium]|jgi:hypothetical protein